MAYNWGYPKSFENYETPALRNAIAQTYENIAMTPEERRMRQMAVQNKLLEQERYPGELQRTDILRGREDITWQQEQDKLAQQEKAQNALMEMYQKYEQSKRTPSAMPIPDMQQKPFTGMLAGQSLGIQPQQFFQTQAASTPYTPPIPTNREEMAAYLKFKGDIASQDEAQRKASRDEFTDTRNALKEASQQAMDMVKLGKDYKFTDTKDISGFIENAAMAFDPYIKMGVKGAVEAKQRFMELAKYEIEKGDKGGSKEPQTMPYDATQENINWLKTQAKDSPRALQALNSMKPDPKADLVVTWDEKTGRLAKVEKKKDPTTSIRVSSDNSGLGRGISTESDLDRLAQIQVDQGFVNPDVYKGKGVNGTKLELKIDEKLREKYGNDPQKVAEAKRVMRNNQKLSATSQRLANSATMALDTIDNVLMPAIDRWVTSRDFGNDSKILKRAKDAGLLSVPKTKDYSSLASILEAKRLQLETFLRKEGASPQLIDYEAAAFGAIRQINMALSTRGGAQKSLDLEHVFYNASQRRETLYSVPNIFKGEVKSAEKAYGLRPLPDSESEKKPVTEKPVIKGMSIKEAEKNPEFAGLIKWVKAVAPKYRANAFKEMENRWGTAVSNEIADKYWGKPPQGR